MASLLAREHCDRTTFRRLALSVGACEHLILASCLKGTDCPSQHPSHAVSISRDSANHENETSESEAVETAYTIRLHGFRYLVPTVLSIVHVLVLPG
jgi:hypothetical protein